MSTAVIAPVNPFAAESKDTVMSVMRRDRDKFTRLVSDPKNWNVDTRCTGWETRDLVGHMIDVMEGYFKNWEAAKKGETPTPLGMAAMGGTLNDHALEFRFLARQAAELAGVAVDGAAHRRHPERSGGLALPGPLPVLDVPLHDVDHVADQVAYLPAGAARHHVPVLRVLDQPHEVRPVAAHHAHHLVLGLGRERVHRSHRRHQGIPLLSNRRPLVLGAARRGRRYDDRRQVELEAIAPALVLGRQLQR